MKSPSALIWLVVFLLPASGRENLVDTPSFQSGSAAFARGEFARAAADFQETWLNLGSQADLLQRRAVASRLLEAWFRNGDFQNAVAWYRAHHYLFDIDPPLSLGREALKWVALSMLEAGFYEESAALFETLGRNTTREEWRKMSLYRAHAYLRSGAAEKAYRVLIPDFPDPQNAGETYFYAGVAYETKRWKETSRYCDAILESRNAYREKARLLKARCLANQGDSRSAVTLLLDLIGETFASGILFAGFDLLVETASPAEGDLIRRRMDQWSREAVFDDRKLAAQYYGILMDTATEEEKLVDRLETFIYENSPHPLAEQAKLMLGSVSPERARVWAIDEKSQKAERLRNRLNFETAVRQFQEESFSVAKESFLEVSTRLEGREREQALFNSAISALYAGDDETFHSLEKELGKYSQVASAMHADLLFLAGLFYASKSDQQAFNILSDFIQNYPDHASVVDARLALAELHLNQVPPQPQSARRIFDEMNPAVLSKKRRERLDYAKLWAEILSPRSPKIRERANAFLANWPESRFRPEVSMLLATDFYEKREYGKAEEAFRRLAEEHPGSRFQDAALFFAVKAATLRKTEDNQEIATGIAGWDSVIANGGFLANHARHQKGLALIKRNRFDEAIHVFDEALRSNEPLSTDLRIAIQCDKGYGIYLKALALGANRKVLWEAADIFAEVAADETVPLAWRYQASVRRGKCLELLGDEESALELYQSVAESSTDLRGGGAPPEENEWVYRAGFFAMEILERKEDWSGAVKLGETLSQRSGPGALEAGRRAEKLRLRYFVWD